MKKLLVVFIIINSLSNCIVQKTIGNGAYSDLSLNVNDDNYEIKRLETIKASGKALWGIPESVDKKRGLVFRFNGIKIPSTGQFLPTLTLLAYTIPLSILTNYLIENRAASVAIALPISGALNNATWPQAASSVASMNLNRELIENNPDTDVFLNPKYDLSFHNHFWTQEAVIIGKVIGARLLINDISSSNKTKSNNLENQKKIKIDNTEPKVVEKKKELKINDEDLKLIMSGFIDFSDLAKLKKNTEVVFQKFKNYYRGQLKYKGKNSNGDYLIYNVSIFDLEVKMWKDYSSKPFSVSSTLIKGYKE